MPPATVAKNRLFAHPLVSIAAVTEAQLVPLNQTDLLKVVAGVRLDRENKAPFTRQIKIRQGAIKTAEAAFATAQLAVDEQAKVRQAELHIIQREIARGLRLIQFKTNLIANRRARCRIHPQIQLEAIGQVDDLWRGI